jgi:hypothetical protein
MREPELPEIPPKPPRRMKQPRKAVLREQLRDAIARVIELEAQVAKLRAPWWRRFGRG